MVGCDWLGAIDLIEMLISKINLTNYDQEKLECLQVCTLGKLFSGYNC